MKISVRDTQYTDSGKIKVDRYIYNELKRILSLKPENTHAHLTLLFSELSPVSQRTNKQNRALHKFFMMLSESLNMAGLEMKRVMKSEIWWTPYSVKENLWKPVQKAMYGKESTTELDKQVEIEKVHEQLMHLLGEKHGVEFIPFPSETRAEEKKIDYPEGEFNPTF